MTQIAKGGTFEMKQIEDLNSQITIFNVNSTKFNEINKAHGRYDFSNDKLQVHVYDALLENNYWCITNRLKDGTTEVDATGTITLAGASGSVDGILVNGVEIMSGSEAFLTDLTTTAENVVANINAFQTDYLASNVGAVITLTSQAFNKTDTNTYTVVTSLTTMTSTDVNISGGVTAIISDSDAVTDEAAVAVYLSTFVGV